MKYWMVIIILLIVICIGIQQYNLQIQIDSLTTLIEKLENRNVPQLNVTGKYPYIEAKKGSIVIVNNEKHN